MSTAGDHESNQRTSSAPAEQRHCWSSLPGDLLGEVYVRLLASVGRARFAAVCTSWRAAASTHPPRRDLPWLMLDPLASNKKKRFLYCPEDGAVLPRLRLRSVDGAHGWVVGCHDGGWVAWSHPPLGIVNLFSGAKIELSEKQKWGVRRWSSYPLDFRKIIFSEVPTSQGCIIAAITENEDLAICAVGCPEGGWTIHEDSVIDIAFCNGELHGLMWASKKLNKFEIGMDEDGTPYFKTVHLLATENPRKIFPEIHGMYIVELCGRIVLAVRRTRGPRPFFAVFKLVDADGGGVATRRFYKWKEVTSLDDHALFLGPTCSKAVHVPMDGRSCAQRNHVYYSHHRCFTEHNEIPCSAKEFFRRSNNNCHRVYYKEDESIYNDMDGIMSVGYYVRGCPHPPMWICPPDL